MLNNHTTEKGKSSEIKRDNNNEPESPLSLLSLFNSKNPGDIEKLSALIQAGVDNRKEKPQHLKSTFTNMVRWLKKYVDTPKFLESYSHRHSLELVAEATFWSVNLKLEKHIQKMSYSDIRNYHPVGEMFEEQSSERSLLIEAVSKKLLKPAWSHEASYALQQAAWCIYVNKHSYDILKKEESTYESKESPGLTQTI